MAADEAKKRLTEDDSEADAGAHRSAGIDLAETPLTTKILVVLCAAMIGFGSHFAGVSFSALKTPLKKELKLSNESYALTQSSDNLLQTVLPLLAGILYDYYGTGWGSLVTTLLVSLGNLGVAIGVTSSSYPWLILGRLVYGAGAGSVNVCQQLIISHWFYGKELATALGVLLTINRLGSAIGQWVMGSATPNRPFWYGSWITVGVSCGSVLFNIAYVLLLKRVERNAPSADQRAAIRRRKTFTPKSMLHFSGYFWLIMLIHALVSGVMNSFLGVAPDFLTKRDKKDLVTANYRSVTSLVVTAAVYPFMGPIVDRFGHRISFSLLSNALLIFVLAMMNWTHMDSTFLMVVFAFTIPFKALASLASLPVICDFQSLGTAFAIYRCLNAVATASFDNLVGVIQDASAKGSYSGVFVFFVCVIGVAFVLNLVWWWVDQSKFDGLLQKNNQEREGFMAAKKAEEDAAAEAGVNVHAGHRVRPVRALCAAVFVVALLATWAFYITQTVRTMNAPAAPATKTGK
ncbi:hypothetical protein H9P43_000381 [Blastocladiella emersonii ATCC 22665]|nr:hypothetical protein H9P43_000381 [Blastocladiella emersonii ATCC 22665]